MRRLDVQIPAPDGHSNGTLHLPDLDGPWPGVLVFPDAGGARETFQQMGDRLAGMGYVALIPARPAVFSITLSDVLLLELLGRRTRDQRLDPRVIGPQHPDPDQPGRLAETRIRTDQGHRGVRRDQARGRHPLRRPGQLGEGRPSGGAARRRSPAALPDHYGRPGAATRAAVGGSPHRRDRTAAHRGGLVMNRRLAYWLLALYPRAWRDQYGPEVASLSGELISAGETTPLRAGLNLIAGAAIERERALARSRRAVLASAAAVITAAAGIALAVRHAQPAGGAMPYFENHSVGVLLLIVVLCWILMEFVELLQVQESREWRKGATKTGLGGWRLVAGTCAITWETWLYLAPKIVPAAAIRPGAVAFALGMAIFLAGIGLRGWSFKALGRYFTFTIMVSPDQPVVTNGPYRMVRHPAYAGGLLICIGVGLMSANWVGLAAMTLLPLAVIVWRIHIEENALLTTLDGRYRSYASHHKRLVPLIW